MAVTHSGPTSSGLVGRPSWTAGRAWWHRYRARVDDVAITGAGLLAGVLVVLTGLPDITARLWWHGGLTVAASAALWWRRARPLLVTLVAAGAVGAGAALVLLPLVLLTLAVHRGGRALAVGLLACEAAYLVSTWYEAIDGSLVARLEGLLIGSALVLGLPVAAGAYLGARRALVASLRDRVERAEADQAVRAERARAAERTRIAREMHDVLGHRITLLALHAGALEINPAAAPAEVERTAMLLRTTAHEAMQELRGILGVLRTTVDDVPDLASPVAPQPTLSDLAQLVREHHETGMSLTLHQDLDPGAEPPALVGRTAYRVVQESLTNATRHAPGASVGIRTSGSPGSGLRVEITNTRGAGAASSTEVVGSGLGLIGLRERVVLAGGRLGTGRTDDGGFTVHAWLPWRSDEAGQAPRLGPSTSATRPSPDLQHAPEVLG